MLKISLKFSRELDSTARLIPWELFADWFKELFYHLLNQLEKVSLSQPKIAMRQFPSPPELRMIRLLITWLALLILRLFKTVFSCGGISATVNSNHEQRFYVLIQCMNLLEKKNHDGQFSWNGNAFLITTWRSTIENSIGQVKTTQKRKKEAKNKKQNKNKSRVLSGG